MEKSTNRGRKTMIDERGGTILIRTARENRRQRLSEIVDNFTPPQKKLNLQGSGQFKEDFIFMESTVTK